MKILEIFRRKAVLPISSNWYGYAGSSIPNFQIENSMKLSMVFRCVDLLSSSVASLPLYPYVFRNNWKEIDEESSIYTILNVQPNSYMGAYTFKEQIVRNLHLQGNAYILLERDNRADVANLWLLNPNYIIVRFNGNNTDLEYYNTITGDVYDYSQIIHIKNKTVDGINGVSTISYAVNSLEFAYNITANANQFFRNGGNSTAIITPVDGVNITPDVAKKMKETLVNSTSVASGSGNGVTIFTQPINYQPISMSAKDAALIESRELSEVDIARFFGVPLSLAMSTKSSNYSTAEQESISFLNSSLTALLEKIENELFRRIYLPSEWPTHELKFSEENLYRTDLVNRGNYYNQAFNNGTMTQNEIRLKNNMPTPAPQGDRYYIQTNLQPTDALFADTKAANTNNIDNNLK